MNKFDTLAKECQSMTFEEGWERIWKEVFSLEKILVAIVKPVEEQDHAESLLFIGGLNEQPCVFGFTDKEHYDAFQTRVIEEGDDRELDFREITVEEFLNFTQQAATQKIPFLMMNFGNKYGFHVPTHEVLPLYNALIKGDYLREQHVPQGAMLSVAIPDNVSELKQSIEQVKGHYKDVLNHVSPVLVKAGTQINLTLVMGFKVGLPVAVKKRIMKNLHSELMTSPLFQAPLHFTEEQNLIPPQLKNVVQVNFQ